MFNRQFRDLQVEQRGNQVQAQDDQNRKFGRGINAKEWLLGK
jgi:hypothetical protein